MTPPSNAGGEGREVLAREVLATVIDGPGRHTFASIIRNHGPNDLERFSGGEVIAAMLAFSARENADDRAPALVEAAVAEMRESGK
jgi:hypothetical protein